MQHEDTPILVTGGAGYIGSHTCKALAMAGYRPVVYDNLISGHDWAVRFGPLEQGDILDHETLRAVLRRHRPVGVMHFAALIDVAQSVADPLAFYRNNVVGTISLLRAMQAEGINRFVFSSSCATYGPTERMPISEDTFQAPINPYGQTKLMVEQIMQDCARSGPLSAVALRYFNAAGADPERELGEAHDPETHLIPLALGAVNGNVNALTINGTDFPTQDGTCIRDYVHVSDLAEAHVKALAFTGDHQGFEAFNLGTGHGASVREVVQVAERVTGRALPHTFGPRRAGDAPALVADAGRARTMLGWQPAQSDLDTIVETAWAWMNR
ncbi:MAG: UDP-glucose 4-epimerase GalE [Pseudomonadota bacterium]